MVQDKKAGPRPKPDNGSTPEGRSDPERPADKRDTRIARSGQREPEGFRRDRKARGKLAAAVIIQSLKDMCQDSDAGEIDILNWSSTESFETICESAGMDSSEVRSLVEELHELPIRIRRNFLISRIQKRISPNDQ